MSSAKICNTLMIPMVVTTANGAQYVLRSQENVQPPLVTLGQTITLSFYAPVSVPYTLQTSSESFTISGLPTQVYVTTNAISNSDAPYVVIISTSTLPKPLTILQNHFPEASQSEIIANVLNSSGQLVPVSGIAVAGSSSNSFSLSMNLKFVLLLAFPGSSKFYQETAIPTGTVPVTVQYDIGGGIAIMITFSTYFTSSGRQIFFVDVQLPPQSTTRRLGPIPSTGCTVIEGDTHTVHICPKPSYSSGSHPMPPSSYPGSYPYRF